MSKILGLHVRLDGGRYRAGFASVDDGGRVSYSYSLHAPTEGEAQQLHELQRTTLEVLRAQEPDTVVLARNESQDKGQLRTCAHAEGVVLAACAEHGLDVQTLGGMSFIKPAGLAQGGTVAKAATKLCQDAGFTTKQADERYAAAAALVLRLRHP